MIGDLLRRRGYEVDDWHIDVNDLRGLRGFGPIEHDFSKARTVVGTYRPSRNAGKSLILQGHCDERIFNTSNVFILGSRAVRGVSKDGPQ